MRWLFGPPKDEQDTARLIAEARGLKAHSRFQSPEANHAFIVDLLVEVCEESDLTLAAIVAEPLGQICLDLFNAEPFAFNPASIPAVQETLEAGVKLRTRLRLVIKVLHNEPHYLNLWRTKLKIILVAIINELPVNALCDPDLDGTVAHESVLRPETPLHDFIAVHLLR
jgi:hypothetical protein